MDGVAASPDLCDLIIEVVPHLRSFARALTHDRDRADDLVQETLVKALGNLHRFEPGSNIRAWLFTILRNYFLTELRKRDREIADVNGYHAERLVSCPSQIDTIEIRDFRRAQPSLIPMAPGPSIHLYSSLMWIDSAP